MGIHQHLFAGGDLLSLSGFVNPTSVIFGGTATAQYVLTNGGDINGTQSNNTVSDRGDWISPKVNMADYSARMTFNSGAALSSGTMGTFVNLGTTRTWTLQAIPVSTNNSTTTIEIRRDSDSVVVASATLTWLAQAEA